MPKWVQGTLSSAISTQHMWDLLVGNCTAVLPRHARGRRIMGLVHWRKLIVRYQATWHKVNSTWRQSRPSFVYSRRKKKNWSPRIRHLFKWPGLFSILLFLLFLWNSFTAMFAFWFTGCDFQRTYFWGYNMFPFFNGLILHKNTRCIEIILFVFSNFITE